jgi:hypothetical protein
MLLDNKIKLSSLKLNSGYYILRQGRFGEVLRRKETYNIMIFETRKNALSVAQRLNGNIYKNIPNDLIIAN